MTIFRPTTPTNQNRPTKIDQKRKFSTSPLLLSARSYEMNDCDYSYNATTHVEEIVCRTWLVAPLMILNGVIIGAGFLEFVAAIWAIAITGTALQKDQVKIRMFSAHTGWCLWSLLRGFGGQ